MKTISGLFNSHEEARAAVAALEDAGISSGDISIVGPEGGDAESGAAEGAGIGAALGGVGGLLAGLGAFAIPGVGPVVGAGWLATTLIGAAGGAAAGGVVGALTDAGVEDRHAHVYAEGVRRGGSLVTARVDETQADAAAAILRSGGSVDIEELRADYETAGWAGFDPAADPWDSDAEEAYRRHQDRDPVIAPFPR